MTLRDDVVFFIFLIQAYMYRVDKSRANEFGYAYEDNDGNVQKDLSRGADGVQQRRQRDQQLQSKIQQLQTQEQENEQIVVLETTKIHDQSHHKKME